MKGGGEAGEKNQHCTSVKEIGLSTRKMEEAKGYAGLAECTVDVTLLRTALGRCLT